MEKHVCDFSNQHGAVLMTTLLVLLAITILGIASLNTSVVESKIARCEKEYGETFYLSEGAAMECIQRLIDTEAVDKNEQFPFWYHSKNGSAAQGVDFRRPGDWDVDGVGQDNGLKSPVDDDIYMAAMEWRVATGGSLVQTASRLYQSRAYGLCAKYGAGTIIEVGYNLRY